MELASLFEEASKQNLGVKADCGPWASHLLLEPFPRGDTQTSALPSPISASSTDPAPAASRHVFDQAAQRSLLPRIIVIVFVMDCGTQRPQ